ncbi:L-fuconolactonase [Microbacterium sp. ru370.1]|uniref:amidohydrolase family protein n=1 Tax=unclassified Microbacterium TaxID=2609290 RepID=UPI00088B13B7|nr:MULTISPECIES: amidohydrolase family protein [unclassified Microbacterium]SDO49021.1 L-fuconolactonase [Microbacterium sp. ru370.1]SIT82607.1 L-fuconolactonase [Microbacterium sp. RU1D]
MIDAHVHLWDPAVLTYQWLEGSELRRPMLPAEFDRGGVGVEGAVFVQAADGPSDPVVEARWVDALDWPELLAIVADADLGARAVDQHLEALAAIPRVAGVRHLLQDLTVDTFPTLAPGLAALAARGGTFDACLRHAQLPALIELLREAPELTVVVDHVAKPPMGEGIDSAAGAAWARSLALLAERPRTFVKLSGLTGEARDTTEVKRNAPAFLAHAVEVFGPERSMIASDWPVSSYFGAGGSFADWVEMVRDVVPAEGWDEVAEGAVRRAYLPGGAPALARGV